MSKVLEWFKALRADWKLHVIAGAVIALVVASVLYLWPGAYVVTNFGLEWWLTAAIAAVCGGLAGSSAGWIKEYKVDPAIDGTTERDDFLWTGRAAWWASGAWLLGVWVFGALM